jgi:hypothetical protein
LSLPELGSVLAFLCLQARRQALLDPTTQNNQVEAPVAATALGALLTITAASCLTYNQNMESAMAA